MSARSATVHGIRLLPADTRDVYRQKLARITLDSVAQFVALLDAQGTVLEVNKAALDAVDLKLVEVEGRPFWSIPWWQASPEIDEMLQSAIARVARGEVVRWDAPVYERAAGGKMLVVDTSLRPVIDEEGQVAFIVAEGRDITERKARESAERSARANSEQQFEQLVAGVADAALYMLDREGVVASWNLGAERIKGYAAEEIIGRHFRCFYVAEDRRNGVPEHALATALREGKYEAEAWRQRKDGTRFWASVLIDAIRDAEGNVIGFAKITRDMTEKRAMQEQLQQAQKMEAIGQLTGGVAHDFNNLLTIILGNLDTVRRRLPETETHLRRSLDLAMQGAQRAATLTSQLLAFSRRQPLNPKPTDVNHLVVSMLDLIRRALGEDIEIESLPAEGPCAAEVDSHHLESAILNLAVNARDAMPNGGRLTIRTANVHTSTRDFDSDLPAGDYVGIFVTDTGTGMTQDVMGRAFDPFFTTKPLGQGTGLGLSQVFGFVKQSGGHIQLESEAGHGASVKIYLPRLADLASAIKPDIVASVPGGSRNEIILVVEDNNEVRAYSLDSLRELGFSVLEAAGGQEALRLLGEHPEIDMLFTDVGLPGINGQELVKQARLRRPDLKVLFTSGYAQDAIIHEGRLAAGVELLTKPFTLTQLAARVRDVLDQGRLPAAVPAAS